MLIILSLVLISALFTYRLKRLHHILQFTTLIGIFLVGDGWVGNGLSSQLQSHDIMHAPIQWKTNNAIVILGAGTLKESDGLTVRPTDYAYARILAGAKQYLSCAKSGRRCRIIISGGDATKTGISEADLYRLDLLALNINDKDIIVENKSLNTFKNAEYVDRIVERENFDNIVLVSSGIHLKRALLYFSFFKLYPVPFAADSLACQVSTIPLGYNFAITDAALHEWIGIKKFTLYNFFGLNKPIKEQK